MSFQYPYLLVLLVAILLVVVLVWVRLRSNLIRIKQFELNQKFQYARHWLRLAIWVAGCVFLVLALARPVWGTEFEPIQTQDVSIMFVLDVSKSMDANDLQPSRLERAKLTLNEMLSQLSGHEMGLVLFAAKPVVQFPLTVDTISVATQVKSVNTNLSLPQGTNIGDAIRLALKSLEVASSNNRLIMLLSDGEGHDENLDSALSDAQQAGVLIYSLAYGTEIGALIPVRNSDGSVVDKTDRTGNPIVSKLDELRLRRIAEVTGGIYVDIAGQVNETALVVRSIDQFAPNLSNRGVQAKGIERFDLFLALAAIALIFESLSLGSFRTRQQ